MPYAGRVVMQHTTRVWAALVAWRSTARFRHAAPCLAGGTHRGDRRGTTRGTTRASFSPRIGSSPKPSGPRSSPASRSASSGRTVLTTGHFVRPRVDPTVQRWLLDQGERVEGELGRAIALGPTSG